MCILFIYSAYTSNKHEDLYLFFLIIIIFFLLQATPAQLISQEYLCI
jgi:hypothetical protein